jgi:predicted transcriptional regulator
LSLILNRSNRQYLRYFKTLIPIAIGNDENYYNAKHFTDNNKQMKVAELAEKQEMKIVSGHQGLSRIIEGGYACDLLSDVMGNAVEGQVWITLQTHKNIMAIASLKELAAVILVKGLQPDEDTKKQSDEEGIPILTTQGEAFETAGKIYRLLQEQTG